MHVKVSIKGLCLGQIPLALVWAVLDNFADDITSPG